MATCYLVGGLSLLRPGGETVIADTGYFREKPTAFVKAQIGSMLTIVKRSEPEFSVVHWQRIAERIFAWLGRERPLSQSPDFENLHPHRRMQALLRTNLCLNDLSSILSIDVIQLS